ncbi:hypothetical protein ABT297_25120 [Dactylosporangium sp. NPDC000555]|uniref:type I-G CRISPR-associated protein, Cas3-extension family n=1 Tax=Dactylosporangium sp. NPDC000555 TaxID=3154260 RepID=UPI00332EEF89
MTTPLHLPALDGRDPLGFLAALGLMRLVTHHLDTDARLSFDDRTAEAVLHSRYHTCDELADNLTTLVATMPADAAIPGLPATYPPAKIGTSGSDPVRVPRQRYPELVAAVRAAGDDEAVHWLAATASDLGQDPQGRVALTPYTAPSGQQTVRSFFQTPVSLVRNEPTYINQALTGWRRVSGVTGEYLDHRVLRSRADHPTGEAAAELGVPGATWLATMALPLLRLTGDGTTITATLWRNVPGHRPTMIWPLWRPTLDPAAITTLIEHPAISPTIINGQLTASTASWPALGIFTIAAARRRTIEGRKNAGVLVPVSVQTRP